MVLGQWILLYRCPHQPLVGIQMGMGSFRTVVGSGHWDGLDRRACLVFLLDDRLAKGGGEGDGAPGGRQEAPRRTDG